MTKDKKQEWLTSKNIFIAILTASILYFAVNSLIDNRFAIVVENTQNELNKQQLLLTSIAETVSRNGADDVVESIVIDCSMAERSEFDRLLGLLNSGLNTSELTELERLFSRCGAFYSERKSIMSSRMNREVDIYETFVNQLSVIQGENLNDKYNLKLWRALAEEEQKQTHLFSKLVNLQERIILTLLEGKAISSPEIATILAEVKEVQENISLANIKASEIRNQIIPI